MAATLDKEHAMKGQVVQAFRELYGKEPVILARAPGRVNLLGSHTDYNEGWVLPAAIDRAIWLAAGPAAGGRIRLTSLDFGREGETNLAELADQDRPPTIGRPELAWLNYPAGVGWAMQQSGYQLSGMETVFAGDIPIGAGVSSSAALEVAFMMAWEALSSIKMTGLQRARLGQQVENQYLRLASGIMDQYASIHGAEDHLILLDCRHLTHELIPFPPQAAILVADSGVRRELTNSEYNVRRQQCREALEILAGYLPGITALRDVAGERYELIAHRLPPLLRRRARHVIEECGRVLAGAEAVRQGDLDSFGRAIRDSHISARDLYEISLPELDILAATAWQVPGCYGARIMGGGFGGCVMALVHQSAAEEVEQALREAYRREFGRTLNLFQCRVSAGASLNWL
jgi:galactokinase